MVQYSGTVNAGVKWNGIDRWVCDRTTLIDNYLMCLKQQRVEYPPFDETREAIKDVLNIYEEVTSSGKKVWQHSPQLPDDSLHAQVFAWFAWKMVLNDLKFYQ